MMTVKYKFEGRRIVEIFENALRNPTDTPFNKMSIKMSGGLGLLWIQNSFKRIHVARNH
jgi:hypothetical protein